MALHPRLAPADELVESLKKMAPSHGRDKPLPEFSRDEMETIAGELRSDLGQHDSQMNSFVSAVGLVDQAVRAHKGAATGSGDVECPFCHGRIDYRFTRGKGSRLIVRMKCRTQNCFSAMS